MIFTVFLQLSLSAETFSQKKKVSLNLQNVSIETLFREIQRQTGYCFVFNAEHAEKIKNISINASHEAVDAILQKLLWKNGLTWKFENDIIMISTKRIQKEEEETKPLEITGVVVDEKGDSIPGVTVMIKGTNLGTSSNNQGIFNLKVPQNLKNLTLIFSFIGMESKEVKIGTHLKLRIILKEKKQDLDEVVITGYANINKNSFTGNSVMVTREELLKVSKTNVIQALQVFDPSFRIQENNEMGSDPNSLPEVYIRGRSGIGVKELDKNSLNKSALENNPNLPTFIMDGFEISVQKLYDLDPNRIESITILKDAAATAMYGSRAANGVVVITTIAPRPGQVQISYNLTGTLTIPDLTDYNLMNAKEKLEAEVAANIYQNSDDYQQSKLDTELSKKQYNIARGIDTYWLSKPLRTIVNHKHSLYIEGGSDNLRYGLDFLYNNENGVMKKSFRDRIGAGFYVDYRIGKCQIKNYISYCVMLSENSPYGTFSDYTSKLPYDEYKDENGNYLKHTENWHDMLNREIVNPLYEAGLRSFDKSQMDELIDNLSINWYMNDYLQLRGQLSVMKMLTSAETFLDPKSLRNQKPLAINNSTSGELNTTDGKDISWDMSAMLSYNRSLQRHHFNFSLAFNLISAESSYTYASYRGFPSGTLHSINYAEEIVDKPTKEQNKTRLFGFLSSLNYTFNNIYLLDASVRMDGSSEFGADKKLAPFWSGGLGVNIHNYSFMKNFQFIELLKLRGSYGVTGKVNFPPFAAQSIYQVKTDEWYKTGFGTSLIALGNKDLGWEKTRSIDVGINAQLFRGAFQLEASYYWKKTVDLINTVTVPLSTGFSTYMDNIGEVMNKGFELQFRSNIISKKDLFFTVFANLAHNKNEILRISESLRAYNERVDQFYKDANPWDGSGSKPFTKYVEGGSLTSIFAMQSKGIDPATGNDLLVRRDGSLTYKWEPSEQVAVGNTEPTAQGAFGFNIRWKNLSLYTTFLYEFGGQRYNTTLVDKVENADIYNTNIDRRVFTERWKKPGDRAKYKAIQNGVNGVLTTNPTERFVQDYNVLTLNSLSLGYDFGDNFLKKMGFSMIRIEVGANDVFRCSSVKAERGLSYPYARTMNFSLRANF